MKRPLLVSGLLAGVGTVPFLVVVLLLPGQRARAVDVYVLFLGALLLLALARAAAAEELGAGVASFEAEAPHRQEDERLPELARMERDVVLAAADQFDTHRRMRPLLREIAAQRLAAKRGIDLADNPEEARALLGDEAWELVQPASAADARRGEGIEFARLERIVESLERI